MSSSICDLNDIQGYRDPDPVVDEALDWLVLMNASGECKQDTQIAFQKWLDADSEHRRIWHELNDLWEDPHVALATSSLNVEANALDHSTVFAPAQISRTKPGHWRYGIFGLAAAALFAIVAPPLYTYMSVALNADFQTATGQVERITLPDGSHMVLDAQSAVVLDYEGQQRGIRVLKGQAWFDVVHDATRPFHVTGQFSNVVVKGTAFSVSTQADKDVIALERGSVEARALNYPYGSVTLSPGQTIYATKDRLSDISTFKPDEALAWKKGWVVFTDKPLSAALDEISQYDTGNTLIFSASLAKVAVSGSYRIDRIDAAIDGIVTAAGGKITRLPGGIKIIR